MMKFCCKSAKLRYNPLLYAICFTTLKGKFLKYLAGTNMFEHGEASSNPNGQGFYRNNNKKKQ